ncbi:hypothetical protein [uncultured Deefgea sp.]|uniref:hypothetical protein n=1 Tax=uncultured Deefgea sp. TaxID=1304914 RepID=UPI0025915FBF|nr:hypothetical protein [uncultured Deefgea sp.]
MLRSATKLCTRNSVHIDAVAGYKFAVYIFKSDGDLLDSNYYKSIEIDLSCYECIYALEVYVSNEFDRKVGRALVQLSQSRYELINGGVLNYEFVSGSKNLIVYFDYSRLAEKSRLYNEYYSKLSIKTNKSILTLSNVFGHWGTMLLFDDAGNLIVNEISGFINGLITGLNCEQVFFVGGSQGATAALVYAALVPRCTAVYAATPVPIDTKNMLKHLKHLISEKDIKYCENKMLESFNSTNVFLFSSSGDEYLSFVSKLAENIPSSNFYNSSDTIKHDKILPHYIKSIYERIA